MGCETPSREISLCGFSHVGFVLPPFPSHADPNPDVGEYTRMTIQFFPQKGEEYSGTGRS